MFSGRGYNEVNIGDRFDAALTLTETHIVLGAGLFGDFNPLHVNQPFAEDSRYAGRIAHGYLTSNVMAAQLGMIFHGTAIAYLEHGCRFTAPVRAGDTLSTSWTITGKDPKPKHQGGVVSLSGSCANQEGVKVAEAEAKMLVRNS
jgi:3-hydroxybutyryl-CoA dehydratase